MPVTTRSQSKNNSVPLNAKGHPTVGHLTLKKEQTQKEQTQKEQTQNEDDPYVYKFAKVNFVANMKQMLSNCENAPTKTEKMEAALKIYRAINAELPYLLEQNRNTWYRFTCVNLNKLVEFENDHKLGLYDQVPKKLVKEFMNELAKTKKFLVQEITKGNNGITYSESTHPEIFQAQNYCAKLTADENNENKRVNFIKTTKKLMSEYRQASDKSSKMAINLKLYRVINDELPWLVTYSKEVWYSFACNALNSVVKMENDHKQGAYAAIDETLVKVFMEEIAKTKTFCMEEIRKGNPGGCGNEDTNPEIMKAQAYCYQLSAQSQENIRRENIRLENIRRENIRRENLRPRRNIPRINYAEMDTDTEDPKDTEDNDE